jgi:hypothetical protein
MTLKVILYFLRMDLVYFYFTYNFSNIIVLHVFFFKYNQNVVNWVNVFFINKMFLYSFNISCYFSLEQHFNFGLVGMINCMKRIHASPSIMRVLLARPQASFFYKRATYRIFLKKYRDIWLSYRNMFNILLIEAFDININFLIILSKNFKLLDSVNKVTQKTYNQLIVQPNNLVLFDRQYVQLLKVLNINFIRKFLFARLITKVYTYQVRNRYGRTYTRVFKYIVYRFVKSNICSTSTHLALSVLDGFLDIFFDSKFYMYTTFEDYSYCFTQKFKKYTIFRRKKPAFRVNINKIYFPIKKVKRKKKLQKNSIIFYSDSSFLSRSDSLNRVSDYHHFSLLRKVDNSFRARYHVSKILFYKYYRSFINYGINWKYFLTPNIAMFGRQSMFNAYFHFIYSNKNSLYFSIYFWNFLKDTLRLQTSYLMPKNLKKIPMFSNEITSVALSSYFELKTLYNKKIFHYFYSISYRPMNFVYWNIFNFNFFRFKLIIPYFFSCFFFRMNMWHYFTDKSYSHIRTMYWTKNIYLSNSPIVKEIPGSAISHYIFGDHLSKSVIAPINVENIGNVFGKNVFNVLSPRIPQIRFRQHYPTMWRKWRVSFKHNFRLYFRYQHRLTRYIAHTVTAKQFTHYFLFEFQLRNILFASKLFSSYAIITYFIKNGFIYINGTVNKNIFFQVQVLDNIQIRVAYNVYLYFIYEFKSITKYIYYVFSLYYKLYLYHREYKKQEIAFRKLRICMNFIMLERLFLFILDVPMYAEIDYMCLCLTIITYPVSIRDLNFYFVVNNCYSFVKMLNWKYLT